MQDDWKIAEWAIQALKDPPKDKPFFLSVGFRHPHVPLYASQKWFDLYPYEEEFLPMVRADDREDIPDFAWNLHWKLPEPRLAWLHMKNQWKPKVRACLASILQDVNAVKDFPALCSHDPGNHAVINEQ